MSTRWIFIASAVGLSVALGSAYIFSQQPHAQPPAFNPASNPYNDGIYANGIVESDQAHGENINIYPEVSGPIVQVLVPEGAVVEAGSPLITIDDSIQRETTDQQKAQIEVTAAQIENARAMLKSATDTLSKQERSFALDPQSVSRDVLDTARNTAKIAQTSLHVYERQYAAQVKAAAAAEALLAKYTVRAPANGVVMSIEAATGSYVSSQGAYDSYTQALTPLVVMSSNQDNLEVRTYVDEILVHRLPDLNKIEAQMYIRGTDIHIPLTFVRVQPYVSPKIELSDERLERVDVRVLPVIFRFTKPKNLNLYPGQLVDVYIGKGGQS